MRTPRDQKPRVDRQSRSRSGQHVDGPGLQPGLEVAEVGLRDAHAPGELGLANPAVLAERPDSVADERARIGVALGVHVLNISTGYSNVKASAICQTVGRRVVEFRRRRGITQVQLADMMGIAQLVKAAACLDVDPGELMTESSALNQEEAAVVDALRAGDPVQVMTAVAAAMGRMRR